MNESQTMALRAVTIAAGNLLAQARKAGLVVTIDTIPMTPLAMGYYAMAATVRQARHTVPAAASMAAGAAPESEQTAKHYPPLTRAEIHDLTCMHAGAPWPDEVLAELGEILALYDQLRANGMRPVDPASVKGGA